MLIGARCLHLRGAVHAPLVGEGRPADVRLMVVGGQVRNLRHLVGEAREIGEVRRTGNFVRRLQREIGEQRDHIRVSRALAVAVDRSLHMAHASVNRRKCICHGEFCVVVRMDPPDDLVRCCVGRKGRLCIVHDLRHAASECAAIGVAENECGGAGVACRAQRVERIVAICLVAIKEVLGVIDHLAPALGDVGDTLRNHREVFGA